MNFEYFFVYPILGKLSEKIIDFVFNILAQIWRFFVNLYNNELFIGYYSYCIEHKKFLGENRHTAQVIGEDNNLLIEALKLWITEICKKTNQKNINLFLSKYEEMIGINENNNKKKKKLCAMPKNTVLYDDLYFRYIVKKNVSREKDKNNMIDESITIYSKKSLEHIKIYIDNIYQNFLNKFINFSIDDKKYFLELQKKNTDNENNSFMVYDLEVSKTFDDLFFENKDLIQKLLTDFDNTKINKLTLLLSGPPGTGKTSIIKAIVSHTSRSVISIKLNNIKNEAELSHIIHCNNFLCEKNFGECVSLDIPKNKRIYIFEDVDAETDLLLDRSQVSSTSENKLIKNLINNISNKDNDEVSSKNSRTKKKICNFTDDLTLSDILNIFDGIREISQSIIIFTTNHPEKLDPAFKRPGRITYHLEMKKITNCIAEKYIKYYFRQQFNYKIKDYVMTMADLEGFCRISNNILELKNILEKENFIIA